MEAFICQVNLIEKSFDVIIILHRLQVANVICHFVDAKSLRERFLGVLHLVSK